MSSPREPEEQKPEEYPEWLIDYFMFYFLWNGFPDADDSSFPGLDAIIEGEEE